MSPDDSSRLVAVAIIPARGGSKDLPRKNLKLLAGRPLLWYTVQAAQGSAVIRRVVVSTEDQEIADYALSIGTEVVRHPRELSLDDSPTYPVVKWAIAEWARRGNEVDICAVLRATTPLRTSSDIDSAFNLLLQNWSVADSVVSVRAAIGVHPIRLKRILPDGRLVDAFEGEGHSPMRRQQLETLYLRNGGIYAAKRATIESLGLWGSHCLAYKMSERTSININTEFDFELANLVIRSQEQAPVLSSEG